MEFLKAKVKVFGRCESVGVWNGSEKTANSGNVNVAEDGQKT